MLSDMMLAMAEDWEQWLERWTSASVIDSETAQKIRTYEASQGNEGTWRWPVLVSLGLGAVAFSAGVLLFVSAHWDDLSSAERMILVVLMLLIFHLGGAFSAQRSRALSIALHSIGTVLFGAAVALTGQIFNLQQHWPLGILLWSLGAGLGWLLLGHWTQGALFAVIAPAWFASEWWYYVEQHQTYSTAPALVFLFVLSIAYLAGGRPALDTNIRTVLAWIGLVGTLPLGIAVSFGSWPQQHFALASVLAWTLTFAIPLAVSAVLRSGVLLTLLAAVWTIGIFLFGHIGAAGYAWDAVGSAALALWGMKEKRPDLVNLGVAAFALTVFIFYFSSVMDRLGRSTSLISLGVLLLGGGWALDRLRRRMVQRSQPQMS